MPLRLLKVSFPTTTMAFRGLPFVSLAVFMISTVSSYSLDCSRCWSSRRNLPSEVQRGAASYGRSTSTLNMVLSSKNVYADATAEVVSGMTTHYEDLEQTLDIIRRHWATQQDQPHNDATQRALLRQILLYQQEEAQLRKARRLEVQQRALLSTQLSLRRRMKSRRDKQKAQQTEKNQRRLLQDALKFRKVVVPSASSESTTSQTVERRRIAESKQRALLEAQLVYCSTKEKTAETTIVPPAVDTIRHFLLEEQPQCKDALIRIACATCPSDAVFPQHVTQIEILSLSASYNSSSLEVAILVCDPKLGDCINVAVPISFSSSLDEDEKSWLRHMRQQLQILDRQALHKLQQLERAQDEQDQSFLGDLTVPASVGVAFNVPSSKTNARQVLQEAPVFRFGGDLPEWWTTGDVELQRECDSLKTILNEDNFRNDICTLAQRQLLADGQQVTDAAVALVGSSGLFVRALLREERSSPVSMSIPFPQGRVAVREELQAAVLKLVESL